MAFKDKTKASAYYKQWYAKNKDRRIAINKKWKGNQRQQFIDFKNTLACTVCGESEYCCLDFHHTDPSEKEMSVAALMTNNRSFESIMKEVNKCIVLCANCHRKHHAGLV